MKRRPRGLALRIYLAGLAQIAALLVGIILFARLREASALRVAAQAHASVRAVVDRLGDEAALAAELERIRDVEDATILVVDDQRHVVATNLAEDEAKESVADLSLHPRHGPPPLPFLPPPPPGLPAPGFLVPVRLPGGRPGSALYTSRSPPSPTGDAALLGVLVLVIVGVGSLLTARALARPLGRVASAARALGAGELGTRTGVARSDEIGDVANAFDEMAARLETLLRTERELLANISHELRTPLARIRVALDLAAEGDATTARSSLGEIDEDLAELERLLADVLATARFEIGVAEPGGSPPLRSERLDVRALVERAAGRFRSAHPGRPLELDLASDLPPVEGDAVLLRRAIDNLLTNADRYAKGPGDVIKLTASSFGDRVAVEVIDQGIGIAEADLPLVTAPFFRADRSRARATGGLGLGLSLTRRIAEAHGGELTLESRLGEGTTARIVLRSAGPASHSHTAASSSAHDGATW